MEFGMGLKKAVVVGPIAGLGMGLSLFVVGAMASWASPTRAIRAI